jgi:cytidyltransferase-like protein
MKAPSRVVVQASLDDLRSDDVRFLEEAARQGPLHVCIPSDELLTELNGSAPKFPVAERVFLAETLRWVESTSVVERPVTADLDSLASQGSTLAVRGEDDEAALCTAVEVANVPYHVVTPEARAGFPIIEAEPLPSGAPSAVVSGCFDWLHSGHIRFFMDAAEHGALYVVIGSDRNVALLKGEGHPLQREDERRYMVGSMKPVYRCLVSSGSGWMDAEPEIDLLKPTYYVVNEDGDKPEKRQFCEAHGLDYVVLERIPHEGLPARSSTDLRGF